MGVDVGLQLLDLGLLNLQLAIEYLLNQIFQLGGHLIVLAKDIAEFRGLLSVEAAAVVPLFH